MCVVAISTISFGQITYNTWNDVPVTDEFGDPTGDIVKRAFFEGTFNNSATVGADLIVKVVDYGDNILIELFEYGTAPGAKLCYDGCLGEISVKRSNGEVESHQTFAPSSGGLYFNKEKVGFNNLIRNSNGETIRVLVSEKNFSKYGSSSYSFTIITQ